LPDFFISLPTNSAEKISALTQYCVKQLIENLYTEGRNKPNTHTYKLSLFYIKTTAGKQQLIFMQFFYLNDCKYIYWPVVCNYFFVVANLEALRSGKTLFSIKRLLKY
jgi:hypothetical protein